MCPYHVFTRVRAPKLMTFTSQVGDPFMQQLSVLRNVSSRHAGMLTALWARIPDWLCVSVQQREGAIKPGPADCKVENRTNTERLHQPRHCVMRDFTTKGRGKEVCGVLKPRRVINCDLVLLWWLHVSRQLLAMCLPISGMAANFFWTYRDNFLYVYRLSLHPS